MNIAVCGAFTNTQSGIRNFIVETLSLAFHQHPEHRFILVTNSKTEEHFDLPANTENKILKAPSENWLAKKMWGNVKLDAAVKKINAGLIISLDNTYSSLSIPTCLLIVDPENIKASAKKAQALVVMSESAKKKLLEKIKIPAEKVTVIYPSAGKMYKAIRYEGKEFIRNKYSNGKEFFLYNSNFSNPENFIDLLRSFSHFKKRQQSSFKLLLTSSSNSFFEKNLASYKYKDDIKFINPSEEHGHAMITAAAYATMLPFNTTEDIIAALNSMQAAVPVITTKDSAISEVAGDAALYAEKEIKSIAEKMMLLYTNENYRSEMIERGKKIAASFTQQKATELLWQSIMKVLP